MSEVVMQSYCWDVKEFGAVGDGETLDTAALQRALDQVKEAGAGRVEFTPGTYKTGTLEVHPRTEIFLYPGATILGSDQLDDYRVIQVVPQSRRDPFDNPAMQDRHLLLLNEAHDVMIHGPGVIDGQGHQFWDPPKHPEVRKWWTHRNWQRPSPMICCIGCEGLTFRDFTIRDSPSWTVELQNCDRVVINGVRVRNNFYGPNTDAFDICGCRDVTISDCDVVCGDDAFCIKTMPHTRSSERITITNCVMRTNCVGLKLGCYESHQDMRQITFTNCVVYNSTRAVGIYNFKGATYEDIIISNIVCDDENEIPVNRPIHVDLRHETELGWGGESPTGKAGVIRGLWIQNVIAKTNGRIVLTAADEGVMEQVTIKDVHMRVVRIDDLQEEIQKTRSAQLSNHSPEARVAQAAIVLDGIEDVMLEGIRVSWPTEAEKNQIGMNGLWARRSAGLVNCPMLRANREDVALYDVDECELEVK